MGQEDFALWLKGELEAQGWKQADLARATGLHSGTIANVLNGQRKPGVDFVLAVARALRVSPEDLYRRAGLLPPQPDRYRTPTEKDLLDILKRLPLDKQKEVINFARFLYQQELE